MDPLFRDLVSSHDESTGTGSDSNTNSNTETSSSSAGTTPPDLQWPEQYDTIPDQQPDESTEAYLERLSNCMMDAINDRRFKKHPITKYMAEHFTASLDAPPANKEEIIVHFQKLAALYPETHVRSVETKAYVYPSLGQADVYMNLEGTGNPPGLVRQGFCTLEWELHDEKWICVKHSGMGGTSARDLNQMQL